jgi:hypothetical protein
VHVCTKGCLAAEVPAWTPFNETVFPNLGAELENVREALLILQRADPTLTPSGMFLGIRASAALPRLAGAVQQDSGV